MTTRSRTIWTFAITSVALFMVSLDNLVVTTAIPVIRQDLDASLESLEWTVNAYTLTFAVLLLTGAALGDRFGRRRLFAIGLGIFTAASVGAAVAPSVELLNVARAVQGLGAAIVMPLTLTILSAAVPPEKRGPGTRRLGRDRRPRRRVRPRRRWGGRRGHRLAVDLLAQRAHRPRARAAGADAAQETTGPAASSTCPASGSRAQGCSGSSGVSFAATARAGRAPRSSSRSGWALVLTPRSCLGAASTRADAADALLPHAGIRARQRGVDVHVLRDVRLDLPAGPVLPDRAGLLGARVGLRILPWTIAPMFIAPVAGALSDRIPPKLILGTGLSLQAVALAWIASVSTPTTPYGDLVVPFILAGVGMALFFAPMANVVLSASAPRRRVRLRVRTTPSASWAECWESPSWPRSSRARAAAARRSPSSTA